MVNYNNSTVYKLHSYDNDLIYIGSTTQPLAKRLYEHKHKSNTCSSKILFEQSDNVIITEIEHVNVSSKTELLKIERRYIENMECVNKNIPLRTNREYTLDNKDKYKQYYKQYILDNKDKIKEYKKQYDIDNKDKSKQYRLDNKDKSKQYRIDNKDKSKQYDKFRRSPAGLFLRCFNFSDASEV